MTIFTRTFHTVGQGAFYSENINIDEKRVFRMIYDCGSTSLSQSDLTKRIKSDFADDTTVDILFISHFDKDHINGIHNIKPKIVVIPFLSDDQIFLLKLYNEIFGETYDVGLAENPTDFFPEALQTIRIFPSTDNLNEENIQEGITIDINDEFIGGRQRKHNIQSCSPITITDRSFIRKHNPIWEYIPYNPNWDIFADEFKFAVKKEGLDWYKLTAPLNAGYIEKHFSVIKNIYNNLKSKNLHSLVVYSNAIADICIPVYLCRNCLPLNFKCLHFNRHRIHSGCIYFGDATIEPTWINSFYRYLKHTNRLYKIGTLQVPHHGSYLSNGQHIISSEYPFGDFVVCIISVGEFNHFGHPSLHIVQELQRKGGIVFMVTEASSSLFHSEGYID